MKSFGKIQRFLCALVLCVFCISMGITAYAAPQIAPEEQIPEGLTEEEKQQEEANRQQEIYDLPIQTNEIPGWPEGPGTYGYAGIVMEVDTGAVLYGKNIDDQHYPASITKVLTALVALENGKMDDPVVVSRDCVSFMQPGDSSIGLKEGDEITLEQALYGMLLASGNEAAYSVGENVGKNAGYDYEWFVEQMNNRCKELGGTNSNFVNANGLHNENHYTSARDMALVGREIFKHPEFFEIVQTLNYTIPASDTCEEHVFQQKHKMLNPNRNEYYEYAVGGKTGYTSDARSTLITMADKDGTQLVCVVLRTRGGKHVYPDTANLFEYGFNNFKKIAVDGEEKSEDVSEIIEDNSGENCGYVMVPNDVEFSDLKMKLKEDKGNKGTATLTYTYEGAYVGSAKAKLSEKYLKEHKIKVEKSEKETKTEKKGLKNKVIKPVLVVILLILIILFVLNVRKERMRIERLRRKRARQRRHQQKEEEANRRNSSDHKDISKQSKRR